MGTQRREHVVGGVVVGVVAVCCLLTDHLSPVTSSRKHDERKFTDYSARPPESAAPRSHMRVSMRVSMPASGFSSSQQMFLAVWLNS